VTAVPKKYTSIFGRRAYVKACCIEDYVANQRKEHIVEK